MDIDQPSLEAVPPGPERPPRGSGIETMARGGLLRGVAVFAGMALALPVTIALIRSIGVADYGALVYAIGIISFAGTVADLGVDTGVLRMASFADEAGGAAWGRLGARIALVSGLAATAVCWAIAPLLHGDARTAMLVAAPLALAAPLRSTLVSLLMSRRRIVPVEVTLLLQQLAYAGIALALVAAGEATVGRIAVAQTATTWVGVLALVPLWRALAAAAVPGPEHSTRRLLVFSLPLLLQSLSWVALQRSDVILLGAIKGTHAVGLYAPALRLVDVTAVGLAVLGSYYIPVTAPLVARQAWGELRETYTVVTKWGIALLGPVLAMLVALPGPLLTTLFTDRFAVVAGAARILAAGYAVNVLTGNNARTLVALGKTRQIAVRSLVALVANLALNAALIPALGIDGAALGTAAVYAGLNVANSHLIWRAAGTHPVRSDTVAVTAAVAGGAVAGLALAALAGWTDALAGPLVVGGAAAVAALTALVATARPEERALLRALRPFGRRRSGAPPRAG